MYELSAMTRTSHQSAISKPPATAGPATAAITGLSSSSRVGPIGPRGGGAPADGTKVAIVRPSLAPGDDGLPPAPGRAPRLRASGDACKPGAAELAANPRARSAVMRVAERTEVPA